jgi:GAF domain-containing protein/HAMP domain-containing protein
MKRLNILNWPLWLKLLLGVVLTIVVPLVLIAALVPGNVDRLLFEEVRAQLIEDGNQQYELINDSLVTARDIFGNLVEQSRFQENLVAAMDAEASFQQINVISQDIQQILIAASEFEGMRLIRADGEILSYVTSQGVNYGLGSDPDSPALVQARSAALQDIDLSSFVFEQSDVRSVDLIYTLRAAGGDPVGFLVGRLDLEHTFKRYMEAPGSGDVVEVYNYLATAGQNPVVLAAGADDRSILEPSYDNSPGKIFALDGQEGVSVYRIGEGRGIEVVGYYSPIYDPTNPANVLFALVHEIPTSGIGTENFLRTVAAPNVFVFVITALILIPLIVLFLSQTIAPQLLNLREALQGMMRGDYNRSVQAADRMDEVGRLAATVVDMRSHVQGVMSELEARVAVSARDISATQEVSRYAATERNLQTLMKQVVNLIAEKYPTIYYAQLFLVDGERENAVLGASTGEVGDILLRRGHRLAVGSNSIVGQAAGQGRTVVVRDVTTSAIHKPNPLLPDTRAELAIPLRIGDQIIGVLDVQSKSGGVFSDDEVLILTTMADQVAVAIENARLYQESIRRLEEVERFNRESTLRAWREYTYGQRARELTSQSGVESTLDLRDLRQRAQAEGRIVLGEATTHGTIPMAVPIQLRGVTLGAVEWEVPAKDLNDNKLQLAQELANRLAIGLDNARLFQESQRNAERERIVNSIAAKLTPQTEISDILQTAVREVGQALRVPQVSIRLNNGNGNGHSNGASANGHHN